MQAANSPDEGAIDPERPIIDPHFHLWEILPAPGAFQLPHRFLLHELVSTVERSGHNITKTVFVECFAMYRADGPPEFAPVGEVEFANGMAAMSASGGYGPCRVAAGIVGSADLSLGAGAAPVLEALLTAAGGRLKGVRPHTTYSDAGMFGGACDPRAKGMMMTSQFRDGVRLLERFGLTLDIWCFHTQLGELADLASAFPDLPIVLDHVGTPESLGVYAGRTAEARAEWSAAIRDLARRPNVVVKLGGLGMDVSKPIGEPGSASSEALAAAWRPYLETCIEAFSPHRCMFESNFPPDNAAGSYGATWNAFKRISARYSESEKSDLFYATAERIYRLG